MATDKVSMAVPQEFRTILENIKKNYGISMTGTMLVIADKILTLDVDWREEGKKAKKRKKRGPASEETKAKMAEAREKVNERKVVMKRMMDEGYAIEVVAEKTGFKVSTIESWMGIAQNRIYDFLLKKKKLPEIKVIVKECNVTTQTAKSFVAILTGNYKPTLHYKKMNLDKLRKRLDIDCE